MKKRGFEAIATLVGTVIGAGVLGIPYVVAQSGFFTGLVNIILIGVLILILKLYLGEVVLRTKGNHQLTGYAEKYLGKTGKKIMTFVMLFGIYGALLAYLIGEGEAFSAIFGGSSFLYSIGFFIFASLLIFAGLKLIKKYELFFMGVIFLIVILISFLSFKYVDLSNITGFNFGNILLPYGVILFAFLGTAAIPEMKEILCNHKKRLKKCIITGSVLVIAVYVLFTFFVVSVTGVNTTEIATVGLGNVLGPKMLLLGNLFAIFAMATSFLTLGLALKQMYDYDYGFSKHLSWFLTCIVPLGLFLLNFRSFIKTIGFAGSIAGGLDGILIVLMAWKAVKKGDRKPEYEIVKGKWLGIVLISVFVLGILYQLFNI
ncbi:hypothetical protein CL618_00985 [archaeon]|nr:hypothetical protein [archaeon]|tara:strand:+ start:2212 stop:3330 length:1119 start_codon:yes stop_codon:yes gene_type:complete